MQKYLILSVADIALSYFPCNNFVPVVANIFDCAGNYFIVITI